MTNKKKYGIIVLTKKKGSKTRVENRIKELRKPLGLSQHRLGKRSGVTRITINRRERDKSVPTLKVVNDSANALGVCIYQVFDGDSTGRYKCLNYNCDNN